MDRWTKILDRTVEGNPTQILPIAITNLTSDQLIILASSSTARLTWRFALTARMYAELELPPTNQIRSVQLARRGVWLNEANLLNLPSYVPAPHYRLSLEIPSWFSQMRVEVWELLPNLSPEAMPWIPLSENASLEPNTGYLVSSPSLTLLQLPVMAEVGDRITIQGAGSAGWRLQQGEGQQIRAGDDATTIGLAGHITSLSPNDAIELVCTGDRTWSVLSSYGNFEIS